MLDQWYVWLVGVYEPSVGPGETGPMRIVGAFSSREKALAAAFHGCFIITLGMDDPFVGPGNYESEWVLDA